MMIKKSVKPTRPLINIVGVKQMEKIDKPYVIQLSRQVGFNIGDDITAKKLNRDSSGDRLNAFWLTRPARKINDAWGILLYDDSRNKIHVLYVPANTLPAAIFNPSPRRNGTVGRDFQLDAGTLREEKSKHDFYQYKIGEIEIL